MLTIDTIGTKTILQFPNKKYFQTSGNVISDCLRISDNIDSTPDTATIFVLKAAGAGEVLNIQVTMRDLLAPFSLPHFQQETGFLSVVAGCWRSVIIPNWSWDKWIVSDAAGFIPSQLLLFPHLLSIVIKYSSADNTRLYSGGKKLQKIPGIMHM